eukprot:227064-Rhodomonas_salina.2
MVLTLSADAPAMPSTVLIWRLAIGFAGRCAVLTSRMLVPGWWKRERDPSTRMRVANPLPFRSAWELHGEIKGDQPPFQYNLYQE